jgi:putative transposase
MWHHVTQRGNYRQTVFFEDADRSCYLRLLRRYCTEYKLKLGGYCLMGNHVHLLAIPEREDSLARALGRAHNDYSRWVNLKRGQTGHVWQNRYYSCPLEEQHAWEALRYVELNPVRAGMVQSAAGWRWSSAPAHAAGTDVSELIDWTDWRRRWTACEWSDALQSGVADTDWLARLRQATRTGRPLGSESFVEQVECSVRRALRPGRRGRRPRIDAAQASRELGIA